MSKGRFRPSYFRSCARMCQGTFLFIILSYENPTEKERVIHYEKSCHHRRSGRTHGARPRRRNPETLSRTALLALGANTTATAAMMKAGAAMGATGENPVLVACRDADLIIGPIGIVIADSLLGEITPAMAAAIRTKPRPENPDSCQWKLLLPPYFSRNTEFTNE